MNTHTQGPWTLRQHATNHQTLTGATAGLIADIHKDEDARLIAAAPDLLKVLQWYVEQLNDDSVIDMAALTNEMESKALAAIRKATGEAA